jgi:hypothetical protein
VTVTVYEPATAVGSTLNPADTVFAVPVTEQKLDPRAIMFAGAVDMVHVPVVEKPPPVILTGILGGPCVGDKEIPAVTVNVTPGDMTDPTAAYTE